MLTTGITLISRKRTARKKNKYMYKNIVYNHIIEHLGSIKLCNLTEDDCQRFINEYAGWSKTFCIKGTHGIKAYTYKG
ncbi:MAG: hypothetical protein ACLTSM_06740 [Eubacterium sp.]